MDSANWHDDAAKDETSSIGSIETLSESGDPASNLEWSIYSAGRSSIAGSDMSSMDFQKMSIHSKMATIVHLEGRQFIERRDLDDGGLPYSAEFYLSDELWKLNGEDCLLMSHRRYIAKVSLEGTVDLEGISDFEEAVRMLLKQLEVVKVLLDEQLEEYNKAKSTLEKVLDKLADEVDQNVNYKRDLILLRILLQKHGYSLNMDFKHDLQNCSCLSSETISVLDNYVTSRLKLIQRNETLVCLDDFSLSEEFINGALQKALMIYQIWLLGICPATLKSKFIGIDDDLILYVSMDVMNLFIELTALDAAILEAALPIIFSKYLARVQEINDEPHIDHDPLLNRIFLYICKSLQEVAEQLGTHAETENAIIYSEEHGWKVTALKEDSQCLRQQLEMLARLANHFEPSGPFRKSRFPYEFKLFRNMDAIPESVRIWLFLLDHCMKDLVQSDSSKMELLSCFLTSYLSFMASEDYCSETLECLRRITHDSLRSLMEMKSPSQHDRSTVNSAVMECSEMISQCLAKFPREHFRSDCDQIEDALRRVIFLAAIKNVSSDKMSSFFNAFKHLLDDLRETSFEWFIQLPPSDKRSMLLRGQFIVPVDNRLKDTDQECLRVADMEGFVKVYRALYDGEEIPKHYQLKAVQVILQNVDKLATKRNWKAGHRLSVEYQLDAMACSIHYIRSSILYLRAQPDYTSFEDFVRKMGEPFAQAIEESSSLEDFRNRMLLGKETKEEDLSNIDSIDHEETLKLISDSWGSKAAGLKYAFKKYKAAFDKHLTNAHGLTREERIKKIAKHCYYVPKPLSDWTDQFKGEILPDLLAELGAIWSLVVSKNESYLVKPSCRQICDVFRLFSLDLNELKHRLMIISTQKDKQLVLGLTVALLARFQYKVQIVCFNSHLARKNATTLLELLKSFSLDSMVSFGTVDDMAKECSKALFNKYVNCVNQCLGLVSADYGFVSAETNSTRIQVEFSCNCPELSEQAPKSILIIDDIDVLLLENKLGQEFERFVIPTIPGLGLLQEKIFCSDVDITLDRIEKFIDLSDHPEMGELRAFRSKTQQYKLPVGSTIKVKGFNNETLLSWHLKLMIHVRSQLTSKGATMLSTDNKFADYTNVSTYLNRKQSSYQQTEEGHKNYGYLSLNVLSFPYAKLLNRFPLILSFGSKSLDRYENSVLQSYSNMHVFEELLPCEIYPARFDPRKNFLFTATKLDWLIVIMTGINAAIERNCSVLVFFEDKQMMRLFQKDFASQLRRMSVTAIETASNGKNLTEHEITSDEVTVLAIEPLSDSSSREVHVIQTFFSEDAKEENLIRRQAERSCSSGSYELILLRANTLFKSYKITYEMLAKLREPLCITDIKEQLKLQDENYEKLKQVCCKIMDNKFKESDHWHQDA